MSRIAVVTVLAMVACAFASEAQTAPTPARAFFVQMTQAERKNSCISVEFESPDSEAILLGHEVERLWNGGQYDEALLQLGNLEARVGHVAIGNSWRKPVPTHQTILWGRDVRVGNRDSLLELSFPASDISGSLFVALRHGHGPAYYSVCMSADSGATWEETFTWVGSPVTCFDAGLLQTHFYVAYYSPGENAQQVRLRRFLCSDGSLDELSNGDMWVAACTLDIGDTAREVSLISSGSGFLFITTLVSDGSVLLSMSTADAVSWVKWSTGITSGASNGLDGTYNLGDVRTSVLLSYVDATDTLRIYGGTNTSFTQRLALFCGTGELTSISGNYKDVICAYEDASTSPQRVRYAVSTDGGDTWTTGTLSDTSIAADAPAVTAPYLTGGFTAVYRCRTPTCELLCRSGQYNGTWYSPHSVADYEPNWSRPGVREVVRNVLGVVCLSDTIPVVRGAYFDRSDWVYGIAEQRLPQTSSRPSLATIVRGVLVLGAVDGRQQTAGRGAPSDGGRCGQLLNAAGRSVMELHAGANDVRGLAPGVYFVREAQAQAQAVRKIVLTR
ncbi:MAG TPA: hypothetical protein VMH22_05185 [bacterium]|nr:hypothetical protein [bacterium]